MTWSFSIGRFAGTEIRVHATFFLLVAWIAASAWAEGGGAVAAASVVFVAALFACVIAHEFGHILMARRYGIRTPDITLLPIGGLARMDRLPERPGQEIAVALAGPCVNIAIWAAIMLLMGPEDPISSAAALEDPAGGFWARLAGINLLLAVFNLVPAFPMDGGRVLRALVALRIGRLRATRLAARIGQAIAFVFGIAGLMGGGPVLILIAVFVFLAAGAESAEVEMRAIARDRSASDAMIRHFVTLGPDDALGTAADAVVRTTQHEFPVIAADGSLAGFLTRGALIEALAGKSAPARVRDAMASPIPTLSAEAPLLEVIGALQSSRAPAVGIVDRGRLCGYVTVENLGEMVMLTTNKQAN